MICLIFVWSLLSWKFGVGGLPWLSCVLDVVFWLFSMSSRFRAQIGIVSFVKSFSSWVAASAYWSQVCVELLNIKPALVLKAIATAKIDTSLFFNAEKSIPSEQSYES
jgi:hypothetical protein